MNTCTRPEFERICPKQFNPSATCNLCIAWDKKERFEYVWLGGWTTDCMRRVVTGMRNRSVNWWWNVGGLFANFLGALLLLYYAKYTMWFNKTGTIFVDPEAVTPWIQFIGILLLALGFLSQLVALFRR